MSERHVVIVGAGPAGIAAALALKDRGIRPTVVDQAESVASSWRRRYDRLRLNTCRPLSHLPKRRFPRGTPMFPTRDQLIDPHRAPRGRGRDRREAGHARGAHRPRRRRLGARDLCRRAACASGDRRNGLRAGTADPRLERPRGLRRRAAALERVQEPGSVRGQAGPGRGTRLLRHGDCLRPRAGRRDQGLALRADPAQHPHAHRPGRAARGRDRGDAAPAARRKSATPSRASAASRIWAT